MAYRNTYATSENKTNTRWPRAERSFSSLRKSHLRRDSWSTIKITLFDRSIHIRVMLLNGANRILLFGLFVFTCHNRLSLLEMRTRIDVRANTSRNHYIAWNHGTASNKLSDMIYRYIRCIVTSYHILRLDCRG